MQGIPAVLDQLAKLLTAELTAADQYFAHSRMLDDIGLHQAAERVAHEREDELGHADRIMRRILFLGGAADVAKRDAVAIGQDIQAMYRNDLDYELRVVKALRDAIKVCEAEQDYVTRAVLGDLLQDTEEDHAYWLEQQLGLIDRMGLQNYIQSAAGDISRSAS